MKLIIQIPCYNEETTLPLVFERMPASIPGISKIEFQIIDDGSTDRTVEVARSLGVQHIVRIPGRNRRWLGRAFKAGVDNALKNGADIVVNTDGDNQYPSEKIPLLVAPIVDGAVDIVIGDRDPGSFAEFSLTKRLFQRLGSKTVELLTGEQVPDAVSGFRAYSRDALLRIHPITNYTYTVDTLMQAHQKGIDVGWVPITPNRKTRESRLIPNALHKVRKSGLTIVRLATVHSPFRMFAAISALFALPGLFLLGRFLWFYLAGAGDGHVQSVVIGGVLLIIGVQTFVLGILGDLLAVNRRLIEDVLTRLRRVESSGSATHEDESIRRRA
ncbi:MAG: glycosyltransferase family 2 protein [Bdellovibrionales bacterium]|nr:glycosyltransferase family 2 protein [Bdellovibrionales bacterium]